VGLETGKMLGGSGSHNDLVHQRGSPLDWDSYAAMLGDASWSYENVLPLFKKTEHFVGELINPDESDYYGSGGPLTVGTHMPPEMTRWAQAAAELGYTVADPNAQQIPSFTPLQKLIGEDGLRVSAYKSYVAPFEGGVRQNLTVIRYANVNKILFDYANRAYGVTYLRHGIPQVAHASKEVVLSAGAINSPLILMMSGVGPRDVLEDAEIPVLVNAPNVGQNMYDHIFFSTYPYTFNASGIPYLDRVSEEELESALQTFLETGVGLFGDLQEGPQVLFASSRAASDGEGNWSDVAIMVDMSCPNNVPMDDEVEGTACFHFHLNRPKSKGSVSLNTTAYKEGETKFRNLAVIDFNGFSDPSDMDPLVEAIEFSFDILGTDAFASMGASYSAGPIPGCTGVPFLSREYWVCYVNHMANTAIHMVGTCAMGSVTDSRFRVQGVFNLRVVDASVLPRTPNANLNYPTILVGEKAAQDILSTWG